MSIGFTVAAKRFFGLKESETLQQFAAELRALTPGDKQEMIPLLEAALGEKIVPVTD